MLVAGRIVSGLSVGLSSAIVPIYQSEITHPSIRGRIVSLQQWYDYSTRPDVVD
jgi:MFS family permease